MGVKQSFGRLGVRLVKDVGGVGGGEVYNSTICLATRTLAKLQTVGRLAHACSTKLMCS